MKKQFTSHLTNVISITLGLRFFSMVIIIPFLTIYALSLKGGAPWLTGFALGIFGLTQAVLQIPFGMLSDRIGYKKMLIAGLLMLIAGLLAAAYSTSIYWFIFSRALQGSGAIVTVGYSWVSAVAKGEDRDKALTKLGAMIAGFNMLSFLMGPLIHIFLTITEMFVFSAVLITFCLVWVLLDTKQTTPVQRQKHQIAQKEKSVYNKRTLTSGLMLTVNNLLMMSFFFMLPFLLKDILNTNQMWIVLTPAIIIAILFLKIISKHASKSKRKRLLYILYAIQGIGFGFLYFHTLSTIIVGSILILSGSFSITTIVPILLNRHLSNRQRGKGNGVMVSLQYFGSFVGASVTGILWNIAPNATFLFAGFITIGGEVLVRIMANEN